MKNSFVKHMLKIALLVALFLTPCLIYLSCKKVDNEISIYDKFAADSDVKQLIVLINENSKNYTFLNPNNTKERKDQILSNLSNYSSKTDEYSQLQVVKIYGYNSFEEYSKFTNQIGEIATRLNEKFPNLKSLPSDSLQSAIQRARQQLGSQLSYTILPNKFGVASIYRADEFKAVQLRKYDCCQLVWNQLQSCYNSADSQYFLNLVYCGLGSIACAGAGGPWGFLGCGTVCVGAAGNYYGSQLGQCTATGYSNGGACVESCF